MSRPAAYYRRRTSLRRLRRGLIPILGAIACSSSSEPGGTETWAADLTITKQVLFMTIERSGTDVSGTGVLASLIDSGGDALTVTGTRRADSLVVTFRRQAGDPFRFAGRYAAQGVVGTLDGAEFRELPVSFRRR